MNYFFKHYYFSFLFVFIILFLTIGFSAFQTNLIVSDISSTVRVKRDIRITDIKIDKLVSGALLYWNEYDVDRVSSSVSLPNKDSVVTYYIEITNIGNLEAGILDISGLPSNLSYSISNYTLGNTLCDDIDNMKCKLGSISTLMIQIQYDEGGYDSNNIDYLFELNFEFCYVSATARIGSQYYDTLQDAIDVVSTDNVETRITLLKNTSEELVISVGKNIVLDMSGCVLSNGGSNINIIKNYGILTMFNGEIRSDASQGAINNYGDFYMSGGKIIATGTKQAIYNDGGNVIISGTSYLYNTNVSGRATVQNQAGSTLTILGGTIISEKNPAVMNNGTLIIGVKDGDVDVNSLFLQGFSYGINSVNAFSLYDGVILGKQAFSNSEVIYDLEDGYEILYQTEVINSVTYQRAMLAHVVNVSFDGAGGMVAEESRMLKQGDKIGSLPIPTRENYVFEGWYTNVLDGEEVTYDTVVDSDVTYYAHWMRAEDIYVAMIQGTKYHTLREAIDDVTSGEVTTIQLIRNTRESVSIADTKNIILDLQQYTLSNINNNAVISNDGVLEIVGGMITSNSISTAIINNTGTLVINGGTFKAMGLRQVLYNDGGTTTITGDAYLSATTDVRATVHNRANGFLTVNSGTIVSDSFAGIYNESGKIVLGIIDGSIYQEVPFIRGITYGIINSDIFHYYDGTIMGMMGAIDGVISSMEDNSVVLSSLEEIDSQLYCKVYLDNL